MNPDLIAQLPDNACIMEWVDISEAPKDGANILLYGGDWVFEGRWQDGVWFTAYPNGDEPTHVAKFYTKEHPQGTFSTMGVE